MTVIKEIKRKRAKSHSALIAFLQNVLTIARESQYSSVAISMRGKGKHYVDHIIIAGTDIDAVIGGIDALKDRVKTELINDEN